MPSLMVPVSGNNIIVEEESYRRMEEIEKRDIMMSAAYTKPWPDYYNHDGSMPDYLLGCAATDDYTGFPAVRHNGLYHSCGAGVVPCLPVFYLCEGKQGEKEIIEYLKRSWSLILPNPQIINMILLIFVKIYMNSPVLW